MRRNRASRSALVSVPGQTKSDVADFDNLVPKSDISDQSKSAVADFDKFGAEVGYIRLLLNGGMGSFSPAQRS
jgi:hypothetical protein